MDTSTPQYSINGMKMVMVTTKISNLDSLNSTTQMVLSLSNTQEKKKSIHIMMRTWAMIMRVMMRIITNTAKNTSLRTKPLNCSNNWMLNLKI